MSDAELRYTKEHEVVRIENDNVAVLGITEFAQDALGDLVYVDLPEVGSKVVRGDDCAVVESVKTAAEIYSPVSGEVVAVNDALSDDPEAIKISFEAGWIVKIRMDDPAQLEALMDKTAYDKFCEEQDD